ncbi:recombinase family protein [Hyphomicrobium sp.]|uniref:recombinase family protein n=1 Tax=Hyphomicrobium sp. TaxID=82 RepID=UPI001D9A93E8|nr:recombinase family protein [Hyphomicrobium sp.]MBY0558594.1 recombinase family protein [Hyphomicrobium sp.]
MAERKIIRCAIYTRKSSDEGLDQDFNSLDAQREACAAYVASQKHEGWVELPDRYDDGGFSGGTMERPGLKQLLANVQGKRVDVIVVYKVDRLTRSLADFAKIVEILDAQAISFVAVTQQFNTTTSMGRLTLNVLLSFAQFEREIAGERIRDKIAASKAKGMWMGGNVPLGYEAKDRSLKINTGEAEKVRSIFDRYLKLGSVHLLADELRVRRVCSHRRTTLDGRIIGGHPISRGSLYLILRNPVHIGQITHNGKVYPGLHEPIIEREMWDRAQRLLNGNRVIYRRKERSRVPSPLAGLVFDGAGERLTPTHTSKRGLRYRYYVSQSSVRGRPSNDDKRWRIPATELEQIIVDALRSLLQDESRLSSLVGLHRMAPANAKSVLVAAAALGDTFSIDHPHKLRNELHKIIQEIEIAEKSIAITVSLDSLAKTFHLKDATDHELGNHKIVVPLQIAKRGVEQKLIVGASFMAPGVPDETLLTAIARAHVWVEELKMGRVCNLNEIAHRHGLPSSYVRSHWPLAFLAPSIISAILEGRQPADLSLKQLMYRTDLALDWAQQRRQLGFDR